GHGRHVRKERASRCSRVGKRPGLAIMDQRQKTSHWGDVDVNATAQQVRSCLLAATVRNKIELYATRAPESVTQNVRRGPESKTEYQLFRICPRMGDQFRNAVGGHTCGDHHDMRPSHRGRDRRQLLYWIEVEIWIQNRIKAQGVTDKQKRVAIRGSGGGGF